MEFFEELCAFKQPISLQLTFYLLPRRLLIIFYYSFKDFIFYLILIEKFSSFLEKMLKSNKDFLGGKFLKNNQASGDVY